MNKYDKLKAESKRITSEGKEIASHFQEVSAEYKRVETSYQNANIILNNIDKKFAQVTKLNKIDITFLLFATALQCIRQYFITQFKPKDERPNDQEAAKNTKGKDDTSAKERIHRWYNPSLEEIIQNPVPFDAIFGSHDFNLKISGMNHRVKTLGHDPILGWIFGTANIATSTLTTWNFQSFHIKTGYTSNLIQRDKITNNADTTKVFEHTFKKLTSEGIDGKIKIGASLMKEAIHLKSDIPSKLSLPIPLVSTISPEFSAKLSEYGIDMANVVNVGKQATYSILINSLIAMIHRLFYNAETDGSLIQYEVKTRKILSYSNLIASLSNIIAVAITEAVALATDNAELAKKGAKYIDIGGILVTCYRLISDHKFISQVKNEFIECEWYNVIVGEEYKFMLEEK